MFGKNSYKPKSNTTKAKKIIRNEMLSSFDVSNYSNHRGLKTRFDCMRLEANSLNGGYPRGHSVSDYRKAVALVDGGTFACYYSQTEPMLNKIYGKKQVRKMSGEKKWNTYRHLIGREYSAMCSQRKHRK